MYVKISAQSWTIKVHYIYSDQSKCAWSNINVHPGIACVEYTYIFIGHVAMRLLSDKETFVLYFYINDALFKSRGEMP